jgi:hypothetical protein
MKKIDKESINSAVSISRLNEAAKYAAISSGVLSSVKVSANVCAPKSASKLASSIRAQRMYRVEFSISIL